MSFDHAAGEPDFAAFIGIDWADREHAWMLETAEGRRESGVVKQKPEDIDRWAMELLRRFQGRPVAVALEQSRGALAYALCKYQHLVLYPVHPSTSHAYRAAMFPSGSKDDPKDTGLLLDLVTRHRDRLRQLKPENEETRKLQLLVENRRALVEQRTAAMQRVTDKLKIYYPQILNWFDRVDSAIVAAFLKRWPTLEQARKASEQTLREFFYQHKSRKAEKIEQRIADIRQASSAITDRAILDSSVLIVEAEMGVIAKLREGIAKFDIAIREAVTAHPDYAIFSSFPGAGAALGPRLVVAFGSDRTRYNHAADLQCLSGIAPVTKSSGRQKSIQFRYKCPKFLRQTFHEYAGISVQFCAWAKQFYGHHKSMGKGHHAAVRALAYKWIRIMFRCWQQRVPYNEAIYAQARRPTPTPTKQPNSEKAVRIVFKKVAGFSKPAALEA